MSSPSRFRHSSRVNRNSHHQGVSLDHHHELALFSFRLFFSISSNFAVFYLIFVQQIRAPFKVPLTAAVANQSSQILCLLVNCLGVDAANQVRTLTEPVIEY